MIFISLKNSHLTATNHNVVTEFRQSEKEGTLTNCTTEHNRQLITTRPRVLVSWILAHVLFSGFYKWRENKWLRLQHSVDIIGVV